MEVADNNQINYSEWLEKFLLIYKPQGETEYVENAKRILYQYKPSQEILDEIWERQLARNKWRDQARGNNKKASFDPNNIWYYFKSEKWRDPIPSFMDNKRKESQESCPCGEPATQHTQLCCRCHAEKFRHLSPQATSLDVLDAQITKDRKRAQELGVSKHATKREGCLEYLKAMGLMALVPEHLQ